MRFHADLHVHSKYSRATSRDLDLERLAWWAARKGIGVVATGDFVHPAWNAELKQKLVPAEPGLFRLKPDIEAEVARTLPASCRSIVRFMLAVEISTIYKKGERTRKIHHLIYAPDVATVDRIAARLARIGNIASDGRPILGLDSRNLLEVALEASDDAYLVPAHIWTPWFAALGSQSGFDSIAECYGDLADRIFAVETGLSSDPAMNWRVSFLDRYRLTSSSDAHSPGKLGREATTFDCAPDYFAMRRALETGEGYEGTVEFFPEEGKYHLDGHRKCGVRLTPRETLANGGRCPVCGGAVTIGVAHRVEALADRPEAEVVPPATAGQVSSLVALPEILSELAGSGPASKAVVGGYDRLLAALGPELWILAQAPLDAIARAASPLLVEAIARLRAGKVIRDAGYDGEYGTIRLFDEAELKTRTRGELLFDAAPAARPGTKSRDARAASRADASGGLGFSDGSIVSRRAPPAPSGHGLLAGLDADQRAAASQVGGPLLIIAGPGSGKTRTLTHRLAHLVSEAGVPARTCLAVTFTRRAAAEMRERLASLAPECAAVAVHTFHSLGLAILREHGGAIGLMPDFRIADEAERAALLAETLGLPAGKAAKLLRRLSTAQRTGTDAGLEQSLEPYRRALARLNWIDFDDLIGLCVKLLTAEPELAALYRDRFRWICVDEFQDVDESQYRLLGLLAPARGNLCVIGDPDQAIYGFRGADAACFDRFRQDYPTAAECRLRRNYRSTGTIVAAAAQIVAGRHGEPALADIARDLHERIAVHVAPTEAAEAEFVAAGIERLIGGHGFLSIDNGRAAGSWRGDLGFADFAVLYRTQAQSAAIAEALARSGVPVKTSSHARIAEKPAVRALQHGLDGAPGATAAQRIAAAAERLRTGGAIDDIVALAEAARWLEALAATAGDDAGLAAAATLATEADFFDPRADRVSLMTMHAAKGLEFRVVFIVGIEDGILPLRWGELDAAGLAEERRLFYVAMTRARDRLFLCRAAERRWNGRTRRLEASPFLADIEAELLRHQQAEVPRTKADSGQLMLL